MKNIDISIMYDVARALDLTADEFCEFLSDVSEGIHQAWENRLSTGVLNGKVDLALADKFANLFVTDLHGFTEEQVKELSAIAGFDITESDDKLEWLGRELKKRSYEEIKVAFKQAADMADDMHKLLKLLPKDVADAFLNSAEREFNRRIHKD